MTALFRRAVALLAGLWMFFSPAFAQGWPSQPVTLVVPWPAGGVADFIARQFQADVQKALGQPLIIENVGGAGGAIGVQKVVGATDGHHLLLGSPLDLIIPPQTNATVRYKPADLRMVALLVKAPFVLIARKDLPAANVDELIALANRQKGKPLAMANTGPGSMFHLVGAKFAQLTGIELLHVPYKGASPAFTDLMGGQVDLMFALFAGPVPSMVADGRFKVIGPATARPLAALPAIPVLAAHPKLAGFEFDSWVSIHVPRDTSDEVAQQLNKALYDAIQIPRTRQAFESVGNQVMPRTSLADLDRLYAAEIARYGAIVKSINLRPQQ